MDNIPTEIPDNEGVVKDEIESVAECTLSQISPPELERFHISFANYKEAKCSVDVMDGRNAQMAMKIVRDIGLDFKSHQHFISKHSNGKLEVKPVYNSPPYDDYYKKLPGEIQDLQEVKEIKYIDTRANKEADLRIFFLYSIEYILHACYYSKRSC